jgi:cbb3-type cytochrome oxidase subunit 1
MAVWFLRVAVLYIVFGVIFGLVIGMREQFAFANVHAHINLLGWATLALAGVIYRLFPEAGNNRLAVAHFWLQNVGLIAFVCGMFAIDAGNPGAGLPPTITGAVITILGIVIFAVNVWLHVRNPVPA